MAFMQNAEKPFKPWCIETMAILIKTLLIRTLLVTLIIVALLITQFTYK